MDVPVVLLANHHTLALPDVSREFAARGLEVRTSFTIVETAAVLAETTPDLVVFQPLTANIAGFEVQHVLEKAREQNPAAAVVLVLDSADPLREVEPKLREGVADFLLRPVSVPEFLARVDFNRTRALQLRCLENENKSLERESITDFKTGLNNDRFFFQRLEQEVARSHRHGLPLSLLIFDFDNFKAINDDFDHTFGDYVLESFGRKMCSLVRQSDVPARLGGDEFVLLLPNTDLEEATRLASRLKDVVCKSEYVNDGHSTRLSLSMGIDSLQGGQMGPKEFVRRADLALIEAKKRGKNRICLYPELNPEHTSH